MIEAHYTLALDDYREANGVATGAPSKRKSWALIVAPVIIVVALGLAAWTRVLDTSRTPGAEPFPLGRLVLTMAPTLAFCLLILFFLVKGARQPVPKPWVIPTVGERRVETKKRVGRSLVGWVIFFSLAVVFFYMMHRSPGQLRRSPEPEPPATRLPMAFDFLLPFVPIFFLFLIAVAWAKHSGKRALERTWGVMGHEQEPRTLRADAEGITIGQSTATMRYAWGHFAGYKETASLLMLYLSPYQFHMIPKRAFVSDAELSAFKGLLMTGVPEGSFLPTAQVAFRVVPTSAAPVVPAQPVPPTSTSH